MSVIRPRVIASASVLLVALSIATAPAAAAAPNRLQRISEDPYTNPGSQHRTQVEPDTFAYGGTLVSAFQSGRYFAAGGSSNVSFARSTDAGATWVSGHLPSLTQNSSPAGVAERATDPSVAFDSVHGTWLISTLTLSAGSWAIVVSRSTTDGVSWSAPVTVVSSAPMTIDKDWVVCDNVSSPFAGRCYVSWTDLATGRVATSHSTDGGLTWSAPVAPAGSGGLGVQPVVQPDGDLVIIYLDSVGLVSLRSADGGVTFGPKVLITSLLGTTHQPTGMRSLPIPSVEVDAGGRIYVVWQDCRFRAGCAANDLLLVSSADGLAWTAPARIPIDRVTSGVDHFIPGLAVDPTSSGTGADLAITYYYFPVAGCAPAACELHVGFVASGTAGARWSHPKRITRRAMSLSWIADTNIGRMVGDYISTSFVGERAVSVVSIANAPSGGVFDQAMYGVSLRTPR